MKSHLRNNIRRFWAFAPLLMLCLPSVVLAQKELTGDAWRHADQAYRAFARQDFIRAVREAERASQLRPDLPQLQLLVKNAREALNAEQAERAALNDPLTQAVRRARSLQQEGRLQSALESWDEALRMQPQNQEFRIQRTYVARSLALPAAQAAYDAFARSDMVQAAQHMEQALKWGPGPLEWHVLRLDALLANEEKPESVRRAIQDAMRQHPQNPVLMVAQAYAEQRAELLDEQQDSSVAMRVAADLGLSLGDGARALRYAQLLSDMDPAGSRERELLAIALQSNRVDATNKTVLQIRPPAPRLLCKTAVDQPAQCDVSYAFSPMKAVADTAYSSAMAGHWENVLLATHLLVQWQPGHIGYRQWQVNALLAGGQNDAARQAAKQGLIAMDSELWRLSDVDIAALAHVAKDYMLEAKAYAMAEDAQLLSDGQLQDAGYAAERVGDVRAAASRFRRVIDAQRTERVALTPQKLQDLRVAVGAMERNWGSSAGVFASSGGATAPGASSSAGRSVQLAAELFWRPESWRGYGTHGDVYVRGTGNLYSAVGERTGWASLQPIVGLRLKPLTEHNLVVAGERLFKAGEATRDDWLVRVGYSLTHQMLGPASENRWMTTDGYAEVGRYLHSGEKYFTSELRHGPQWNLASRSDGDWALWGYGVLAIDRSNVYADPWSASAGLGVGLRRLLRGDAYRAARSWIDITVQYREHLGGDVRNSGWVLRLNWNH